MADANQSNLTITGIGGDPSGTHPIGNLLANFTMTDSQGIVKYLSKAGDWFTDTDVVGIQYGPELAMVGAGMQGMYVDVVDSGDVDVHCGWQWFNSKGTSFDANGDHIGGTWTDIGTHQQNFGGQNINAQETNDWDAIQQASKWRVKVESVTTPGEVKATLNAASAFYIWSINDKVCELNQDLGAVGGIGADPS